jgi:pyruvate dehydrogenase E2 component (dihydrolipoamide acetyltransferase)
VGMPLAEIETEKALVEYAAEEAGVVGRLILGEGDTGEIGEPIAVLLAAGESDADVEAALGRPSAPRQPAAPVAATEPGPAAPALATGSGSAPPAVAAADPGAAGQREAAGTSGAGRGTNGHHPADGRIFASPLVRKLAGQRGVDLSGLTGTGPNGRIVRRDLERYLAGGPVAPGVPGPGPRQPSAVPRLRRAGRRSPLPFGTVQWKGGGPRAAGLRRTGAR